MESFYTGVKICRDPSLTRANHGPDVMITSDKQ